MPFCSFVFKKYYLRNFSFYSRFLLCSATEVNFVAFAYRKNSVVRMRASQSQAT